MSIRKTTIEALQRILADRQAYLDKVTSTTDDLMLIAILRIDLSAWEVTVAHAMQAYDAQEEQAANYLHDYKMEGAKAHQNALRDNGQ